MTSLLRNPDFRSNFKQGLYMAAVVVPLLFMMGMIDG